MKDQFKPNPLDGANEKQANQNKKTSIEFSGTKTFYNQTVNKDFFKTGQLKQYAEEQKTTKDISHGLKKDLQKEHFKLGNDQVKLKTTNMDLNGLMQQDLENIAQENALEKVKNKKLKEEMRQSHFRYGDNAPLNYNSMTKAQFKEYNLSEAPK